MARLERTHYVNIQGWMVSELELEGDELIVYAVITEFSRNEDNCYWAGWRYLADWCGGTRKTIDKALRGLVEKGLIEEVEPLHRYRYKIVPPKVCD